MIKRTVEVSTPGTRVFLRDKQLVVANDGGPLGSVPFEDLGVLILSSSQVLVSTGALEAAVAAGAVVIVCDEKYHPAGLLLPIADNSLHAERLRSQVAASQPLKKRLWARVIATKIRCQASLLRSDQAAKRCLLVHADHVRSGDPDNREAQASRVYWSHLFAGAKLPEPFRRDRAGQPPNGLLNYGYAVLRATMARAICGAGLHPAIGIHHHNRYNAFCLADDLMEPYRPLVDRRVLDLTLEGGMEVTSATKVRLLQLLGERVVVGGESGPLMIGMQRTAASLCQCLSGESTAGDMNRPERVATLLHLPDPDALVVPDGEDG